jgi:DNA-directed RNA polymerase subunit K/omega
MTIVDNQELKAQNIEFYSFQLQEQFFRKLNTKKKKAQALLNYQKTIQEIEGEDKTIEKAIRELRKKLESELDVPKKDDMVEGNEE